MYYHTMNVLYIAIAFISPNTIYMNEYLYVIKIL